MQENMTGSKRKMHLQMTSGKCSGHLSSAQELEKSHRPWVEGGQTKGAVICFLFSLDINL